MILGILPWNFPAWQVLRFAVPTILSGNSILLKHAENVQQTANQLEKLIQKHFGNDLYQNLRTSIEQTEAMIKDPRIRGVSLTGSTRAGKRVAALAGAALKPCVLELGGSDPYLVLDGVDVKKAAMTIAKGRSMNAGQSCISPKRILVEKPAYAEFEEHMLNEISKLELAQPPLKTTRLGPIAREDLLLNLDRQVKASIEQGAICKTGGRRAEGAGFYYVPTLLTHVQTDMVAFREELFGPVAVMVEIENIEQGLEFANNCEFGLGAAVFAPPDKVDLATQIARDKLDAGCCFVNDFVKSDPAFPFGGTKQSGYGRELAKQGLLAFTNAKTVAIRSAMGI